MATKFVTLKEAKDYCKVDNDKSDWLFNTLIESYTANIQNWTGKDIVSTTYNEKYDIGYRQKFVFLKQYPIISIVAVTSHTTAMVENTDYVAEYDTGILKKEEQDAIDVLDYIKDFWYEGQHELQVTYIAGYATVPSPIKLATLKLVKRDYFDSGVDDVKHRNTGGEFIIRYDLKDGMPQGVYTLLHPYRRITE